MMHSSMRHAAPCVNSEHAGRTPCVPEQGPAPAGATPSVRGARLRQSAAVALAGIGAAGCSAISDEVRGVSHPAAPDYSTLPEDPSRTRGAVRVLNRVAYGPRPGDAARVAAIGPRGYVEEQLADRMDDDPVVARRVDVLDVQQDVQDAPDELPSLGDDQLLHETQQAALLRAVYSRHQLRETLADFWTNHFNVYALKSEDRTLIPVNIERALRPHLLGSFRDMLAASARSPAMLTYLDNRLNRRGVPNENYARELMELHTLGVHSGYSQRDIQEVARCFTGWTVNTGFFDGQLEYNAALHDPGAKYIPFLNLRIRPDGGERDAEQVLDALAAHPATARFLAGKLCRRYLGCAPPQIQAAAARAYLANDTSIRAMLRPILLDGLFQADAGTPIFKRPLDLAVSALRALAADTDGGPGLQQSLAAMGQPLYQWPMPDGFPERASAWTNSLLPRWQFALSLASNAIPGTSVDLEAAVAACNAHADADAVDGLTRLVYSLPADAPHLSAVRAQVGLHAARARSSGVARPAVLAEVTGLLVAAPAFQWR